MHVQEDNQPYDEINVTPMLDLAYVLLVIFIIMTTASVQGVRVESPKAQTSASLARPQTKAVTISERGDMFLDAYPVTIEQLEQFCIALRTHEGRPCWVHCAKNMRVSAFLYIYRSIFLNEPEEIASDPMVEIWEPNPIWRAFIDDAMRQFAKRRRPQAQPNDSIA